MIVLGVYDCVRCIGFASVSTISYLILEMFQ